MSKVIVSLYGGLGNQLFQYATAFAVAYRNNAELIADVSWFNDVKDAKGVTVREFALAPFDLNLTTRITNQPIPVAAGRKMKLLNFFGMGKKTKQDIPVFNEKNFQFDNEVLKLSSQVHLNGYWQSYQYFSDVADLLRKLLGEPKNLNEVNTKMMDEIMACDAICLHVRRGDYVTNPSAAATHGLCSIDYYNKGMAEVLTGLNKPKCFIFSDDPEWARENLKFDIPVCVVDINGGDAAHFDLWLMAKCKYFIIANSSFSWWGAWLSNYEFKKVVAPKQWFLSKDSQVDDLIPSDWIRV